MPGVAESNPKIQFARPYHAECEKEIQRRPLPYRRALVQRGPAAGKRYGVPQFAPAAEPPWPHKKNANGRHHIPKMRHAVTNWAEYEVGLRRRGSLTLWITEEAIAA